MEASGINVTFLSINSKAYDVSSLELGLGQEILMVAPNLDGSTTEWFFNNDSVLAVSVNTNAATIKALETGSSTIRFMQGNQVVNQITITVVSEQAVKMGLKQPVVSPK